MFEPVLSWINSYVETPNPKTEFHFDLNYFNTSSAKQLFKIITSLTVLEDKAIIYWHYEKLDEDMLASGERFEKITSVPFRYVAS